MLTANVTIVGPGAKALAVKGGGAGSNFNVFTIDASATAVISGLTVTGANHGTDADFKAGTIHLWRRVHRLR